MTSYFDGTRWNASTYKGIDNNFLNISLENGIDAYEGYYTGSSPINNLWAIGFSN